ncbi:hypothetical protein FBU59_004281 [Linderina macrospora]|uniref:Uncharacterized protein n=1 Tax=Linderina macrospora TaxID=4868 RepID=A0ACC1J673_9FUNG|nr:hypothetical protein FBU59_004281 [Linderina macrospora]
MLITDGDLELLEPPLSLVIHHPPSTLQSLNAWCQKTHKESGLLDEVAQSTLSLASAEQQMLDLVTRHCPEPNRAILAGNNVGFDRKFLSAYMPILHGHLHFRNVDVSSLNELAKRWRPDLLPGMQKQFGHRALDDINESLRELRYYKSNMIK